MRIPKYQAWHKTLHKMDEVTDLCTWRHLVYVATEPMSWTFAEIELRAFTGLVDKHGKDIYEGDIVRYVPMEGGFGIVTWMSNAFLVCSLDKTTAFVLHDEWEVIGNIYETPALLKEEVL